MNKVLIGKRQNGVVAILVGISLFLFVGLLALVIDLGHLYLAKTELQNAADAAALSGAKRLDGTALGVNNPDPSNKGAVQRAIEAAAQNEYDFSSKAVDITIDNIWVGNCPEQDRPGSADTDGCTMVPAADVDTDAEATDKTFLMVDTNRRTDGTENNRDLTAWFARIWSTSVVSTYGMAVAGRYVVNITPLGVCAINLTMNSSGAAGELLEFGFRRGIAYNIPEMNPLGPGNPMLINPVDAYPSPCDPSHDSANFTAPFVCAGNTATITALPTKVYRNTGFSAGPIGKAFNSRFDDYAPPSSCDPASAPPDTNICQYRSTATSGPEDCGLGNSTNLPKDWMDTTNAITPTQQTIELDNPPGLPDRMVPVPSPDFSTQYGVLWTYNHAVHADTDRTPFHASNADWSALYNGGVNPDTLIDDDTANGYPNPADDMASPYNSDLAKYTQTPSFSHPGRTDRRVLNIAIIDCDTASTSSCGLLDVVGIGRFFMQVPADFTGSPKKIEGEFAGLITQIPPAEIRLYR